MSNKNKIKLISLTHSYHLFFVKNQCLRMFFFSSKQKHNSIIFVCLNRSLSDLLIEKKRDT